jgi:hypothetical protein
MAAAHKRARRKVELVLINDVLLFCGRQKFIKLIGFQLRFGRLLPLPFESFTADHSLARNI